MTYSKYWKENNHQPRILYQAKLSFKKLRQNKAILNSKFKKQKQKRENVLLTYHLTRNVKALQAESKWH